MVNHGPNGAERDLCSSHGATRKTTALVVTGSLGTGRDHSRFVIIIAMLCPRLRFENIIGITLGRLGGIVSPNAHELSHGVEQG